MTGAQRRLTGRIQVALPPAEAFRLFTPRGEQDWVHGWHPRFPAPAPGDQAGTVTVAISAAGHHSEVEVTYHLTALTGAAVHKLGEFADRYGAYLRSWQDAIAAWLRNAGPSPGHHSI